MSQVLARKWRPKNFHELVGQEHVTQTLTYALSHNEIHHAYLFTGTRGVGKTTIARIFSKSLNCKTNGITAEPCGTCEHCREIDEGRFPDLIEVDAASKNSADETRQLLNNVPYAPIKGRFKVYLIDEVHMFSNESFNALLKTLEEPPEHVKFILATTEVQKLPATVLSRCIQFQLKNMTPAQIEGQLEKILSSEGRAFDKEALEHIAEAADGSMRDSLSLLDQAIAFGQGSVRTAQVSQLLGTVPSEIIRKLFKALADGQARAIRDILTALAESSPDYANLMRRILEALQQITIVQLQAQRSTDEVNPELTAIAYRLPAELVQLWYQIATDSWQNLPYQPNLAAACEMALLRMLALQPILPQQDPNSVQAAPPAYPDSEHQPSMAEIAAELNTQPEEPQKKPEPQPAAEKEPSYDAPVHAETEPAAPAYLEPEPPELAHDTPAESMTPEPVQEPPVIPEQPAQEQPNPAGADLAARLKDGAAAGQAWHELVQNLHLSNGALKHILAENVAPAGFDGETLYLEGDAQSNLHLWQVDEAQKAIEQRLSQLLGTAIRLQFQTTVTDNSRAKQREAADAAEQARAEQAFMNDPAVQHMIQAFGAQVQEHSIYSLKNKE